MSTLNQINLIGNITNDINVKETPSGAYVAQFTLATNHRYKQANGEYKDEPQYHRIVAWRHLAELMRDYGHKGKKIFIDGRVHYSQYEAKDGTTKQITEIVANRIVLLGEKGTQKQTETKIADEDIPF